MAKVELQVAETKKVVDGNNWKVPEGFIKPEGFDTLDWYTQIKMSDPEYWESLVEIEDWFQVYTQDYDSLSEFLAAYEYQKRVDQEDALEDKCCHRIFKKCERKYREKPKTLECLRNDYIHDPINMMKYWQ